MSTIGTVEDDLAHVLAQTESATRPGGPARARLEVHFSDLHRAALSLFGGAADGAERLDALVEIALEAWHTRSLDLKVHGDQRAADPQRLSSRYALGAACYADRYAGNLAGLRDEIPYLRHLGVSLLHVLSPFAPGTDGRPDLTRIDPGLGSMDRLSALAADLRLAGISLAVDVTCGDDPVTFARDVSHLAGCGVEVFVISDTDAAALASAVLTIGTPGVQVLAPSPGSAPLWESLATGDAAPLRRAVSWRSGATGITSIRDADAVHWAGDGDALTAFYERSGRGVAADGGLAGTTASLAGLGDDDPHAEARVALAHALALSLPGVPMLWLGDEVGQLNDDSHRDDPERRDDPRWLHRGQKPRDLYAARHDTGSAAGRVFQTITKLIAVRHTTPEFDGSCLVDFEVPAESIVAFQRPGDDGVVLVIANVGSAAASIPAVTFSGFDADAEDLVDGIRIDLAEDLELAPYKVRWLRVVPRS